MNIMENDNKFPITIIYTKSSRVSCSGENNDHPLVWYSVPEINQGYVKCKYCDIRFERKE